MPHSGRGTNESLRAPWADGPRFSAAGCAGIAREQRRGSGVLICGSDCVGIGLNSGGNRMLVEPGGVLPRHLSDDVIGEPADLLMDGALGVRPGGVAVRVVGLEQDVVRADPLVLDER